MQKLLRMASPHKLELSGLKADSVDWKPVDVRKCLEIELAERYADSSYTKIKTRNLKYAVSKAAIAIGTVSLTLTLISFGVNFFWKRESSLSVSDLGITPLSAGGIIFVFSLPLLSILAGVVARRKLNAERFDPLHANGQNLFISPEMSKKWNAFLDWLKTSKADIGVEQKNGTIFVLTPELTEFELAECFILGETRHRDQLISDSSVNMSPLVMRERDWQRFKNLWKDSRTQERETSRLNSEPLKNVGSPKSLETKPHARDCPRFKYMLRNKDELFRRYVELDIQKTDIQKSRWPCHNLLMFFSENLDLMSIYFDGRKSRNDNKDQLQEFKDSIDAILEIKGEINATRLTELQQLKWRLLEKHIETVELIPDDELSGHSNR